MQQKEDGKARAAREDVACASTAAVLLNLSSHFEKASRLVSKFKSLKSKAIFTCAEASPHVGWCIKWEVGWCSLVLFASAAAALLLHAATSAACNNVNVCGQSKPLYRAALCSSQGKLFRFLKKFFVEKRTATFSRRRKARLAPQTLRMYAHASRRSPLSVGVLCCFPVLAAAPRCFSATLRRKFVHELVTIAFTCGSHHTAQDT